MLFDGPDAIQQVKALQPPIDAETERELIATAFADGNTKLRLAAMRAVKAYVADAPHLSRTLGPSILDMEADEVTARLFCLKRADRSELAAALARRWPSAEPFAILTHREFARAALLRGLHKDTKTLVLSQDLPTVPDAVFDELAWLRKHVAFDRLVIWGSSITTLPARLVQLAPFLKRLSLGSLDDLTAIPDVVCELRNLEELWIGGRKLRALHPRLSKLVKLKRVALARTGSLKQVPPEIFELPALRELMLLATDCKLPPAIGNLRSLEKLSLIDVKPRKLPAELASMPKLREVDIRFSKLDPKTVQAGLPPKTRIVHKTVRSDVPLDLAWGYDRQPRSVSS